MGKHESWRVLTEGDEGDLVLAVDYSVSGRPEAGFSELLPRLGTGYAVWETLPPPFGKEPSMSGGDYVEHWLGEVRASGRKVKGVLGYCVGSTYAAGLAAGIREWQSELPATVLFDPESPNEITLCWQFSKAMGNLSALLSPEEVTEAQEAGHEAQQRLGDLQELRDELIEIFRRVGGGAFARIGLDAAGREEFTATFASFMHYLSSAADIDAAAIWRESAAIGSVTPTNGLNLVPPADRASFVGKEFRFDLEHADLLRNDDVAKTVAELLN